MNWWHKQGQTKKEGTPFVPRPLNLHSMSVLHVTAFMIADWRQLENPCPIFQARSRLPGTRLVHKTSPIHNEHLACHEFALRR